MARLIGPRPLQALPHRPVRHGSDPWATQPAAAACSIMLGKLEQLTFLGTAYRTNLYDGGEHKCEIG
jgi:hypothetical protein